jgi:RNA recognition motif-containing protein
MSAPAQAAPVTTPVQMGVQTQPIIGQVPPQMGAVIPPAVPNAAAGAPPFTGTVPPNGLYAAPPMVGQPQPGNAMFVPPQFKFVQGPPKQPKNPPPTTPRRTLYVHNLNERIKLDVMKKSLEAIFSPFGEILEINIKKNLRMRGQAFVVMKDVESATRALNVIQGFPFYNKLLDIQYARIDSDIIAKMEGTYEQQKRKREEEKERRLKEAKKPKETPAAQPAAVPIVYEIPNNILFIQNLPEDVTKQSVSQLFQQYPGFKEVRLVPGKKDLAFIEYETEQQAGIAKQSLNGYLMSESNPIKVSFAKK